MGMTGRGILVTGGATGIGLAVVDWFRARGDRVAAGYLDEAHRAEAEGERGEVLWLRADLRREEEITAMVERARAELGAIGVLVNCASMTGTASLMPFLDCTASFLDEMIGTNLRGAVLVSQAVARAMVRDGQGGAIVHVASVGALAAQEHASVYCATKAAQVALGRAMALELAAHGIRVNCVSPGDIQTEASADVGGGLRAGGAAGRYLRHTPLGRRGRAGEIAAAIGWLASDEASFVTGANLVADGGFLTY